MQPVKSEDQAGEIWRWSSVNAVDRASWHWLNFTPQEMACKKSGVVMIRPHFMDQLQELRSYLAFPLPVTSGYRSPEHNAQVSSTGDIKGPHVSCQAVDIAIRGAEAYRLIGAAIEHGFEGVGARQHGNMLERFVHLDRWMERVKPRFWTYDQRRG